MVIRLNWKTRIDFSNITIVKQWLAQMIKRNGWDEQKFGDIVQAD